MPKTESASFYGILKGDLLTLLNFGLAPHKVIEGLSSRFGTENGEGQVVVLEIEPDTWEVDNGLDASSLELLGIT